MAKNKFIIILIVLIEFILLFSFYFNVLKYYSVKFKEIKKLNLTGSSSKWSLNFEEKLQKLPQAIIIGESKCGKLYILEHNSLK